MARRFHRNRKRADRDAFERVSVLVSTYESRYWYMESVSLLHKLFFTGAIHNVWPETRFQVRRFMAPPAV